MGAQPNGASSAKRRDAEVLDAAARVFYAHGYAGATVQGIAAELGILKGSLYHYIDTKEDLLFWLLEEVHRDTERILDEVEALAGLDPVARLEEYVRRQMRHNLDNLVRISVYYRDIDRLSPVRLDEILLRRRPATRFVASLIREAQSEGGVDAQLDSRVLTNCIFATMIWICRWYRPGGAWSRDTVVQQCTRYVVDGITAAPLSGGA
jgi:AcrR family transcriptional regulator